MRNLIALVLLVFASACTQNPDPNAPAASSSGEPIPPTLQGNGQGPDVNPDAAVPASSPDCKFRAGEACFRDAKAACKAAGCEEASCVQRETFPVQVSCKK